VPAGPILDVKQALEQPVAEPLLLDGAGLRGVRSVAFEPSDAYRPRSLAAPPALGADTEAVLGELLGIEPA
jgi:crotonobetainyl-CoA:carnitine CoA-transferase CaiB-like acyl-CoA transferase